MVKESAQYLHNRSEAGSVLQLDLNNVLLSIIDYRRSQPR